MSEIVRVTAVVLDIVRSWETWIAVGAGVVVWYVLSCLLARSFFKSGQDADLSIAKATIFSTIITAVTGGLVGWIYWDSVPTSLTVTVLLIILPLLLVWIINRVDSTRQAG